MKDFVFHGQLQGVDELEAVGAEELDAVVAPRIVRGGDDHAGVKAVLAGQERDGGRGYDAGALDAGSGRAQAGGERGGDPGARFAGIAAEEHGGLRGGFAQRMGEGKACCVDGGGVERRFTGNGANAVGAEEFPRAYWGHRLNSEAQLLIVVRRARLERFQDRSAPGMDGHRFGKLASAARRWRVWRVRGGAGTATV